MIFPQLTAPDTQDPGEWPAGCPPIIAPADFLAALPLAGLDAAGVEPLIREAGDQIADFLGYSPAWQRVQQDWIGTTAKSNRIYMWQRPVSAWPLPPAVSSAYGDFQPLDPSTYNVDYSRAALYKPSTWQAFTYDALIAQPDLMPIATVKPAWQAVYYGGWWLDSLGAMTAAADAVLGATSITIQLQGSGYPPGLDAGSRLMIGGRSYRTTATVGADSGNARLVVSIAPALAADIHAGDPIQVTPAGLRLPPSQLYRAVKTLVQRLFFMDKSPADIKSMTKDGASIQFQDLKSMDVDSFLSAQLGAWKRPV